MTAEANAAVQGAIAGGAEDILVNDSHGGFRNLLPDGLDERARLVLGKPRYLGMMGGLEEGCDAVFMIGYHSRSQGRGILAHTINSFAFARVFINGMELGEAGLYGALAGEMGVPVILATGDDVFISETSDLFPGAQWVQTKVAHGQGSGVTLSPAASPRHRGRRRDGRAQPEKGGSFPHPRAYRMPVADAEPGAGRPVLHVAHAGARGRRDPDVHHGQHAVGRPHAEQPGRHVFHVALRITFPCPVPMPVSPCCARP